MFFYKTLVLKHRMLSKHKKPHMNISTEIVENWEHFEIQIKEQVNKINNLHISVNTNKENI